MGLTLLGKRMRRKSSKRQPNSKRRLLGFQALERRNLLAAHLSELLVSPLFGDSDTDQYVEIRGEPGESLADGTYLVIVEEGGFNEGEIHGIFDLSNQQLGSNGYLAILQQDHPYEVHPDANALVSTDVAFGGLPGDIYTDSHPISNRIDFIIGANAYILLESDVPPELEQDIDVDDDGLIDDAILNQWNILDSISLHPFVGSGDVAYGQIVFTEGGNAETITVAEGVEVIPTEGFGYAGRIGESTGHREVDWIQSTVQNEGTTSDGLEQWGLADNLSGTPSQFEFSGRDLDHIGEANFVGGVRGTVRVEATGEPREGLTVFADTNGNGIRDSLTFVVDPDDAVDPNIPDEEYPLLNTFPGVTITNFSLDSFPSSTVTAEQERDFPNTLDNRIFATGLIDWFSNSSVLRFDYYRPVNSVSIDAIGDDNSLSRVYGRIEAYNENGELLDTDLSSELIDGERETITVSTSSDSIAYVFAYADTNIENGSPFGRFDRMVYSQLEAAATTDENGYYEIQRLFPDNYQVLSLIHI